MWVYSHIDGSERLHLGTAGFELNTKISMLACLKALLLTKTVQELRKFTDESFPIYVSHGFYHYIIDFKHTKYDKYSKQ